LALAEARYAAEGLDTAPNEGLTGQVHHVLEDIGRFSGPPKASAQPRRGAANCTGAGRPAYPERSRPTKTRRYASANEVERINPGRCDAGGDARVAAPDIVIGHVRAIVSKKVLVDRIGPRPGLLKDLAGSRPDPALIH
jgi:hypothetical protein